MPDPKISAGDREFFGALADVVFGNSFSAQRAELILRLAPNSRLVDREALARVGMPRLEPYLRDGRAALGHLSAADRKLLEPGFLYVCYHRAVPQLDAQI